MISYVTCVSFRVVNGSANGIHHLLPPATPPYPWNLSYSFNQYFVRGKEARLNICLTYQFAVFPRKKSFRMKTEKYNNKNSTRHKKGQLTTCNGKTIRA